MDYVYGHAWLHDCLAFADASTAAEEADEIVAIATAPTYGAAGAIKTRHIFNPVPDMLDEAAVEATDELNIFDCWGVSDGDWPPMVTSRGLTILPRVLVKEFGRVVSTTFNGDYLEIPLTDEQAIFEALNQHGSTARRDDNLINVLDGRTFNPAGDGTAIWPSRPG
jgi:hypothetical protein